jgi:transposase
MEQFIGCDAHKKYSVFVALDERGEASQAVRVDHDREQYRQFLKELPSGSQIALEASGHYYWLVDEMEGAGHHPRLAHPLEAKKRMGKTGKKTDKVDARGLGILLRNGTLPEVWIPPAVLRDQRELLRLRMFLVQQRTRLKNRIQGVLAATTWNWEYQMCFPRKVGGAFSCAWESCRKTLGRAWSWNWRLSILRRAKSMTWKSTSRR